MNRPGNDVIRVESLELRCRVGVTEAERSQMQRLEVTLQLGLDFRAAAFADDLAQTVDYYALCLRLEKWVQGREWRLIETLGEQMAELILLEFGPPWVQVELRKYILPQTRYVAVVLRRYRDGNSGGETSI